MRDSMTCLILAVATALSSATAVPLPPQETPVQTDELRQYLAGLEASLQAKQLRFVSTIYGGQGTSVIPAEGLLEQHDRTAKHTSLLFGKAFRISTEVVQAADSCRERLGERSLTTFDGSEYRRQLVGGGGGERSCECVISKRQPQMLFAEHWLSWQGWAVFQSDARVRYRDFLDNPELEGPRIRADGLTEWRIPPHPTEGVMEVRLVAGRINGQAWLQEAVLLNHSPESTDENPDTRMTFRVRMSPPAIGQELLLPQQAEISMSIRLRDPTRSSWSVTRVTLLAAEGIPDPPGERFRAAPPEGAEVRDERYRINYVVGGRTVEIDGRVLRVPRPLDAEVGEHLESWIAEGAFE